MEIRCFCPHCGQAFKMEINDQAQQPVKEPKADGRRNVSEEVRRQRAEHMRALRAQGIGGRPKGSKNKATRSDAGLARGAGHAEGQP